MDKAENAQPGGNDEHVGSGAPTRGVYVVKGLIAIWLVAYSTLALVLVIRLLVAPSSVCTLLGVSCADTPDVVVSIAFVLLGGVLGAGVLGMVTFHQYVSMLGTFDLRHAWGFLFAPLLASILGLVVFAFMQSGLLIFAGPQGSVEMTAVSNLGYLSVGFLSGFGWYPATQRIQQVVHRFFGGEVGDQPEAAEVDVDSAAGEVVT